MQKIIYIYIFISIFVIIYLVWLHYSEKPIVQIQKEYVQVEIPKEVVKIKKVPIKVEIVKEIPKVKIKEKLPNWLENATEQVILSINDVEKHCGKTRVMCVLNTKSGEGTIIAKQLKCPREPFLQFRRDFAVEMNYDFFNKIFKGRAKFSFLKISKINFHLYSEGKKEGVEGGVGIEMRF